MIQSKFKIFNLIILVISLILFIITLGGFVYLVTYQNLNAWLLLIPFVFIVIFILEFKRNAIKIAFSHDKISWWNYFGYGQEKCVFKHEIEGYTTSVLKSESGDFQVISMKSKNETILRISEFYHENYPELKAFIQANYKDLGWEEYSLLKELKNYLGLK